MASSGRSRSRRFRFALPRWASRPAALSLTTAEKLYAELTARGIEVILDDRDERPGVKFKDSELIGFPIRVAIGEKSLAKGEVEVKVRGGPLQGVKIEAAVETVAGMARAGLAATGPAT